jgi:hypothetical protein
MLCRQPCNRFLTSIHFASSTMPAPSTSKSRYNRSPQPGSQCQGAFPCAHQSQSSRVARTLFRRRGHKAMVRNGSAVAPSSYRSPCQYSESLALQVHWDLPVHLNRLFAACRLMPRTKYPYIRNLGSSCPDLQVFLRPRFSHLPQETGPLKECAKGVTATCIGKTRNVTWFARKSLFYPGLKSSTFTKQVYFERHERITRKGVPRSASTSG